MSSDAIELPYRWLLIVRKSNFAPLAPGTKPLPAHLARKPENRKELDLPVAGNPFGDGPSPYQWAEFETVNDASHVWVHQLQGQHRQQQQKHQIWYYLGPSSTECRAQYTHNPSVPVHNPRANFLDSVRSLGAVNHSQQSVAAINAKYARTNNSPAILQHHAVTRLLPSAANAGAASASSSAYPHHRQHNHHGLQYHASPTTSTSAPAAIASAAPHHTHQQHQQLPTQSHLVPAAAAAAAATAPPVQRPLAPPPPPPTSLHATTTSSPSSSAMPSAYRSLPTQSARHAPYPQITKAHLQQQNNNTNNNNHNNSHSRSPSQQQQQSQQLQQLPTNTFANVRELIARRRLAQITDHANVFAGYNIVSPELVVETLLGPMGSVPPSNGLEKLELAMAQQRVQPRAVDGTLLPLQPLNMRSEEVNRLLQMLRFSLVSHRERLDVLQQKKESENNKAESVDRGSVAAAKMAGKFAFLDKQRSQVPTVYQSPYDHPSGFTKYAEETFGLIPCEPELPKPSLANDYFASLSQEDQEKIMKTCGSYVQRAIERSTSHSRQGSASNSRLASVLAQQTENPTIDITPVEDMPPLSALDLPLHADSPCSSFSRSHLRFQSPNDFTPHGVESHNHDHHELFGDQQANMRFWQNGPWEAGDGNTPNEENRPFFGPHERLKNDYASSDISLGRGPGSLHSVDMAGFGLDATDDICAELSP